MDYTIGGCITERPAGVRTALTATEPLTLSALTKTDDITDIYLPSLNPALPCYHLSRS